MPKKLTYVHIKEQIESEGFVLLSDYVNARTKIKIKCDNGHIYNTLWSSFRNGSRCPECSGLKKLTNNDIKNEIEKHGFVLLSDYVNTRTKIKIKCDNGHITNTLIGNFRNNLGRNKCSICRKFSKDDFPLYNTYASKINYAEKVRRNENNRDIIEVKCTYCGKWYIPNRKSIIHRINSLNGNGKGESRFYCSNKCKKECPIYLKKKYSSEETNSKRYSREVQPELRQMVFERDNWTCQGCKKHKDELKVGLHCHHVEGVRWEPLESADIDKCITYCKKCHKKAHEKEECGYQDLKCNNKTKGVLLRSVKISEEKISTC